MTAAEEVHLGTAVRTWLDWPDGADAAPPRIQRAGRRARERMINANLRLVAHVVGRYKPRLRGGMAFEDLLQEGVLGLARAAEKFDPASGYKLSTYATWWIRQSAGRAVDVYDSTVRLPADVCQLVRRWHYKPAEQSFEEFAAEQGRSPEWVRERLEQAAAVMSLASLDAPLQGKHGDIGLLGESIAAPEVDPLGNFDQALAIIALEAALPEDLEMVERSAVMGVRLSDFKEELGITLGGARQRLAKAKGRLAAVAGPEIRELVA